VNITQQHFAECIDIRNFAPQKISWLFMSKGKLEKFADMETYENVFQYPFSVISDVPFEMKGHWREQYFKNNNPIVLELGCGKGEYAVELAKLYPDMNFIGVDIKGARMWTGATLALKEGLKNVAFLRTNIEIIDRFFAEDEVQEIWLTFSDPQMKNPRKRLTSTFFMERYRRFLADGGIIHLKTDSNFLFTYTTYMVEKNSLPLLFRTEDLYHTEGIDEATQKILAIQTYYESMWIARGLNIRYMKFGLPRTGTLKEPDVEIELDEYRSYHRTKRSSKDKAK
jgi:tRNA (guanine-N7-)-methyltransferase